MDRRFFYLKTRFNILINLILCYDINGGNMKLDIILNDALLMWNLLYQSSVSEDIHELKQKLWVDYKKDYTSLYRYKKDIMEQLNDFIPDDDKIFTLLESSLAFRKIRKETNKYRLNILEIWDRNKKNYLKELEKVLKCELNCNYTICVLHPNFNIVEADLKSNLIIMGKKITTRDKDNFLTYLIYKIIKNEFLKLEPKDALEKEIINAIVELVATNEFYTRVTKESKYNLGKKSLRVLKEQIYPYWLMYLGVKMADMEKYMIRDNIFFHITPYIYDERLASMDIFTFINYVLKHKEEILKQRTYTVEDIEVL